tara:strand:- start:135 stop:266 length:132 start_codon:yes stop_codon:yes gene_type:complete
MDIAEVITKGGIALIVIEVIWWILVGWFILSRRKKKLRKNKWV